MAPGKTRQIREKQRRSETGTMDPGKTRQIYLEPLFLFHFSFVSIRLWFVIFTRIFLLF
jgi:hypothetical protein